MSTTRFCQSMYFNLVVNNKLSIEHFVRINRLIKKQLIAVEMLKSQSRAIWTCAKLHHCCVELLLSEYLIHSYVSFFHRYSFFDWTTRTASNLFCLQILSNTCSQTPKVFSTSTMILFFHSWKDEWQTGKYLFRNSSYLSRSSRLICVLA